MQSKLLLTLSILSIILVSGCVGGDASSVARSLPEIQQFLKEHPNADIQMVYYDVKTVTNVITEIQDQCGSQMDIRNYWKATFKENDVEVVTWIDAGTNKPLCIIKKGSQTNTTTTIPGGRCLKDKETAAKPKCAGYFWKDYPVCEWKCPETPEYVVRECETACPADVKRCDDNSYVSRNPCNDCKFGECPKTTTTITIATTTTTIPQNATNITTTTTTLPDTTATTTTLNNITNVTTTTIPSTTIGCSATQDGICPSGCAAGSDYDCCSNAGYCWTTNGCYTCQAATTTQPSTTTTTLHNATTTTTSSSTSTSTTIQQNGTTIALSFKTSSSRKTSSPAGGFISLTATSNQPATATYPFEIWDTSTGKKIDSWQGHPALNNYIHDFSFSVYDVGAHYYQARVGGTQSASNTVAINVTPGWSVLLSANNNSFSVGTAATLTATANQSLTGTGYSIEILGEAKEPPFYLTVIKSCYEGTACIVTDNRTASGVYAYLANVVISDAMRVGGAGSRLDLEWTAA